MPVKNLAQHNLVNLDDLLMIVRLGQKK